MQPLNHEPPPILEAETAMLHAGVYGETTHTTLSRMSAHRRKAVKDDRCHRCGERIKDYACCKPGSPYVWCVNCW